MKSCEEPIKYVLKSPTLHSALPSPPRVAFRNPKAIRDKLVLSKFKEFIYKDAGTNICCHSNCDIYKILESRDQFESTVTKKKYRINFSFDCNSCCVVYLLTCKVRLKQYVTPTVTRWRLRFNQYKSNIKLYGEGRRGLNQEKISEHFFLCSDNETPEDNKVQIIEYCDPNNQNGREDFGVFHLDSASKRFKSKTRFRILNKLI